MQQAMKQLHEAPKLETAKQQQQRDRHIVTWTPEEDDMLREQIAVIGTDRWTTIAAKFKDKTSRQCRRRWYTYLNSECKKGGWSPEEDMILCEAQKIFGNRWTEIAKVVSGRTDNAVKNRFSTLCKKRAKHEALSKENNIVCINQNNKRVIFQNGCFTAGTSETTAPFKKIRTHISDLTEGNYNTKEGLLGECGQEKQQLRSPLAQLVQNFNNVGDLPPQHQVFNNAKAAFNDGNKVQGTFIKRDDPKITALMQQAELLSSLALKVNMENTDQSLENAWKELQEYLTRTEEGDLLRCKIAEMDFLLEDFRDLVEDLKSGNTGSRASWRQPDLHEESQGSSDCSTGSTRQFHAAGDKTEQHQSEESSLNCNIDDGNYTNHREVEIGSDCRDEFCTSIGEAMNLPSCDEPTVEDGSISVLSNTEFSSPLQTIPSFNSFTVGIQSPKFSESERHFLMRTLGLTSPSSNPSQAPTCKKALLNSL